MKKVLVFGVFDGLHNGHRKFLREAKKKGDCLVVIVTRDEVAELLKNKKTLKNLIQRMAELGNEKIADLIVPGDKKIGSWAVLEKHKPDIVALGYDQVVLKAALEEFLKKTARVVEVAIMKPHQPDKYHSSIIQKRRNLEAGFPKIYSRKI